MPRLPRVVLLKQVKIDDKWRHARALFDSKGRVRRDHVRVNGKDETGHEHMHIAWSRIDTDTMTAQPLPFFKLRLKEACRELENELDLTPVRNEWEAPSWLPTATRMNRPAA